MRITIVLFFLFNSLLIFSQENFKILSYTLSDGFGKEVENVQEWIKEKNVEIATFQGVKEGQEEIQKMAKKWKHKNVAVLPKGESNIVVTSKYAIKTSSSEGFLKASIKGIQFYVVQINQDSFKYRQAAIEVLATDIEKQLAEDKKVLLLGHIEGYSKADSAIYSQRFRAIPVEDRANREIIRQISSYVRSKNYQLLGRISETGLLDPVGMMREGEEVESTFPSKKVGDFPSYRTYRIDYAFISPTLKPIYQKTTVLKDKFTKRYSAHYPLLVELKMEE